MIFIIITLIDQIIKSIVALTKCELPLIDNFISLSYAENTGGIYGLFSGNNYLFAVIACVILFCLFLYVRKDMKKNKIRNFLWQLILAGGVSNLLDRCFRGYVVDFIQMKPFGIFNIADACIVIGVCVIFFIELKEIIGEKYRSKNN